MIKYFTERPETHKVGSWNYGIYRSYNIPNVPLGSFILHRCPRGNGGEGNRTPVLAAFDANIYMCSQRDFLRSRRCTGALPTSERPRVRSYESGAVAPPIRQPAVHVFAASRRRIENVAVN